MQETENASGTCLSRRGRVFDFHLVLGRRPKTRRSNREFAWCVPSLHKATHTRTQSRKKGGERRSGEKEPRGGKKTQGRKKPRGGNTSKENARSCSRHPPCLIPTGRWPESRRPEPGGAGPLGRMCSPPDELNVLPRRARQRDTKLHRAVRDPPEPP